MDRRIGVVIIDDSAKWLQRFEALVVELADLTVVGTAGTPQAAVEIVESLRPPIMILDVFLSGSSGIDVLRALSHLGAPIQVVVVTGTPSAQLRACCLDLGARYFLDKAFEFDELRAALRSLAEEEGGKLEVVCEV